MDILKEKIVRKLIKVNNVYGEMDDYVEDIKNIDLDFYRENELIFDKKTNQVYKVKIIVTFIRSN
jgi:hypothetical protein